MPGTIVLPKKQNPLEQVLPQFLMHLFMMKARDKVIGEREDSEWTREKEAAQERREWEKMLQDNLLARQAEENKLKMASQKAEGAATRKTEAFLGGAKPLGPRDMSDVGDMPGTMDIGGTMFQAPPQKSEGWEQYLTKGPDGPQIIHIPKGTKPPPSSMAMGKYSPSQPAQPKDQALRNFELQYYGKLVPELRGTPDYISKLQDAKKAGAMNINIAPERFSIQKMATAGDARTGLVTNKDDKNFYEANVSIFNTTNKRNEVAYWDKKSKWYADEQTKMMKLSPSAIAAGWTPEKIQQAADSKGKSIQEVLKDLGMIK